MMSMVDKQKIIQYWQVEKKSEVDISTALGISRNTVRRYLKSYFRALEQCRITGQGQPVLEEFLLTIPHYNSVNRGKRKLTPEIMQMLVKGGMRSVALAPEAGSECLRQSIKKGISEPQILEAVRLSGEAGMQHLKLYFMIGLPGETEEDIQAIVDLAQAGKKLIENRCGKTRLTLNVSPFVPKAGTPFQRMPMAPVDVLQARIAFLKNRLAGQGIKINNESPQWSEVQAVLSRGDSSLVKALADIEKESLPAWHESVEKHQINTDYFAHQEWQAGSSLPWSIIESTSESMDSLHLVGGLPAAFQVRKQG